MKEFCFIDLSNSYTLTSVLNLLNTIEDINVTVISDNNTLSDEYSWINFVKFSDIDIDKFLNSNHYDLVATENYYDKDFNITDVDNFVNLHYSLLPSFKMSNPIENSYKFGIKVGGVTVHYLNKNTDNNCIIAQYPIIISELTHYDEYKSELINLAKNLYPIVIKSLIQNKIFDFSKLFYSETSCNCCGKHTCKGCVNR